MVGSKGIFDFIPLGFLVFPNGPSTMQDALHEIIQKMSLGCLEANGIGPVCRGISASYVFPQRNMLVNILLRA